MITSPTFSLHPCRKEGVLLLKKLEEMSERLKCMEEESAQNYRNVMDFASSRNPSTDLTKGLLGPAVHHSLEGNNDRVIRVGTGATVDKGIRVPSSSMLRMMDKLLPNQFCLNSLPPTDQLPLHRCDGHSSERVLQVK